MRLILAIAAMTVVIAASVSNAGGPPPMYVVVSKVETTQCKGSLSSIRIWGTFTRLDGPRSNQYTKPVNGYMQFGYGSNADAPKWRNAAGTGKAVAVGSCHEAGAFLTEPIHSGRSDEKDVRSDTPYPKDVLERFGDIYANGEFDKEPHVKALYAAAKTLNVDHSTMSKFIQSSVFDGLKEDGVSREFAAQLSRNPDYVGKCSLCSPTREAFVLYSKLEKQPEGKGLKEDLRTRLASANAEVRHSALRELVQQYMERGYAKAKMSADERMAMQKVIEEQRKASMGGLPKGQKFCPACDGASCALPR
jgi:hypothetical protein